MKCPKSERSPKTCANAVEFQGEYPMNSHSTTRKALSGAVGTALAAALVVGFAASGSVAQAEAAHSKKAERKLGKTIALAEKRVQKAPQDAAARASLGNTYLLAGRFESAVTALEDARYLGDTSARSALGLALAQVGVGNGAAAVAVLDSARDTIPVSDYGLALALAGETGRGVDVLAQALRGGENTAKLRQNLAYAYALDGRWNEARVMASQDVPADQLDKRITGWAKQGKPEDFRLRVASILGTSVRADEGQPAYLAISRDPTKELASLPVPSLAAAAPARTDNNGELPPVENGESFWLAEAARPEPAPAPLGPEPNRTEVAGAPPLNSGEDAALHLAAGRTGCCRRCRRHLVPNRRSTACRDRSPQCRPPPPRQTTCGIDAQQPRRIGGEQIEGAGHASITPSRTRLSVSGSSVSAPAMPGSASAKGRRLSFRPARIVARCDHVDGAVGDRGEHGLAIAVGAQRRGKRANVRKSATAMSRQHEVRGRHSRSDGQAARLGGAHQIEARRVVTWRKCSRAPAISASAMSRAMASASASAGRKAGPAASPSRRRWRRRCRPARILGMGDRRRGPASRIAQQPQHRARIADPAPPGGDRARAGIAHQRDSASSRPSSPRVAAASG
jgi:tetratricopeptide (TPR) repeat protein